MAKRHEDLLKGLKRTQAEEVHCSVQVVGEIIGHKEAEMLCLHKISLSQKDTKERSLVAAMKDGGKVRTDNIGTFDRADLVEIIEEVGLPTESTSTKEPSALERLYEKMGKNKTKEDVSKKKQESIPSAPKS